jgi:two-component system, response regulator PdtaR
MADSYRIAIADPDTQTLRDIANVILQAKHLVIVQAGSVQELRRDCQDVALDLIVSDIDMLDSTGLPAAALAERLDLPMIGMSNTLDCAPLRELNDHIFAYLQKPVCTVELLVAIPLAAQRFDVLRALRAETLSLQCVLADRKLIERAKGIIMRQLALDEDRAYQHLQKLARSRRLKMSNLARSIILAHDAIGVSKRNGDV